MNVPKSIFRQYDVRGLVDTELTPDLARALGRAFASVAWERVGRAPVLYESGYGRRAHPSVAGSYSTGEATGRTDRQPRR